MRSNLEDDLKAQTDAAFQLAMKVVERDERIAELEQLITDHASAIAELNCGGDEGVAETLNHAQILLRAVN